MGGGGGGVVARGNQAMVGAFTRNVVSGKLLLELSLFRVDDRRKGREGCSARDKEGR